MALTQLTKVDGGGISTTSDYRVGIITASKFIGPFDGTGGNFSGVVTATDGVFSGNVTIGGTLTYEDVTNIDSVGIITARDDIKIIADNKKLKLGVGGELELYQSGNHSIIQHHGNHYLSLRSNAFNVMGASGNKSIFSGFPDTFSSMYYNGS